MAVGDIYSCSLHYNIGSELTMNVIHLRETTECTDSIPAQAVGSAFINEFGTHYGVELFSAESLGTLLIVRRVKPTAGVPSINVLGATQVVGIGATAPVPSTSALLISLYSDVFTKSGRGRVYVPGVAVASQNDGQLDEAGETAATLFANMFEEPWIPTGVFTGEWEAVVYSRKLGTAQAVTQAVAHTNLASQKGRRNFPGIGA